MIDWTVRRVDSPIEDRLYQAIMHQLVGHPATGSDTIVVGLRSQFQIGSYRADFALWLTEDGERIAQLVVEADGREFHTRDADARRDLARDAALARMGWTTIRFTGSRIWREAPRCAVEVVNKLDVLAACASPRQSGSLASHPEWASATAAEKLDALRRYFEAEARRAAE